MSHRVIWFDIPVADLARARQFYAAVLEVRFEEHIAGSPVAVMQHKEEEVSGCLILKEGFEPSAQGPLLYFNANHRIRDAVDQVKSNGGQVLEDTHSIGPFGYRAIVLDSEGNRIVLHAESV